MKLFLNIAFLFLGQNLWGQINLIDYILNLDAQFIPKVDIKKLEPNQVFITSEFSEEELKSLREYEKIKSFPIKKIELVYTKFALSENFNQKELNRKRLETFKKYAPEVFETNLIEWQLTSQTGCNNPEQCGKFFHGFVITFMNDPAKKETKSTEEEIEIINKIFAKPIAAEKIKKRKQNKLIRMEWSTICYENAKKRIREFRSFINQNLKCQLDQLPEEELELLLTFNNKNRLIEVNIPAVIAGCGDSLKIISQNWFNENPIWCNTVIDERAAKTIVHIPFELNNSNISISAKEISYTPVIELPVDTTATPSLADLNFASNKPDTTISTILSRNTNWKNILVVEDVTGSMYPYTAQVLIWEYLNSKSEKIKKYTFFNDGDNKPDFEKKPGITGGVYFSEAESFEEVRLAMLKTMKKGRGGDIPENNIEALIKAIQNCPECDDVIMIADNLATPRDLMLLGRINKPIKVILCGTEMGLNTKYLKLIRETGGSLHTLEEDIIGLMELIDGESISISGQAYIYKNGEFKMVY